MPLAACLLALTLSAANAPPDEEPALVPPTLVESVAIDYPPQAAAHDPAPAGTVEVELTIGTDGVPRDLRVVTPVHPALDEAALEAVGRLRYTPGTLGGAPIEVTTIVPIEFLPPPAPPAAEPSPEPSSQPAPTPEPTSEPPPHSGPAPITGTVLEAGKRIPIRGVSIVAIPAAPDAAVGPVKKKEYVAQTAPTWQARAVTDDEGRFDLRGVRPGKVRLILLAPGYERVEVVESLGPGTTIAVKYYLARLGTHPYRTVVEGPRVIREEVTRRTITTEEIGALPGTQGDALKAITNFPGINRAPFGIGLLVIRGSDPTDSAVYLGQHQIPQLFHFGGITSVFNADILDRIDFIPGNFDTRYGDATGGVIDVYPRRGRRDGFHGYVDTDLFDTGVLAEGPVGKGSLIVSGRRSYIDLILPAVIPDDAGLELAVAPRYYDYQVLFDYPVSRGTLTARVFGSDDRTRLVAAADNDVEQDERNAFETKLLFHRADLQYENKVGRWDFLVTPSYRYDDVGAGALGIFRFRVFSHVFSGRAEAAYRVSDRLSWQVGTEVYAGTYSIDAVSPPVPTGGTGDVGTLLASEFTGSFAAPALYTTLAWRPTPRLTLLPGVRVMQYAIVLQEARTDPRLRFRWDVGDHTWVKGGVGLYSQIPDPPEFNERFGNPRIGTESALHVSASVGHDFEAPGVRVEATGFYKRMWDLATTSTAIVVGQDGSLRPENFANHGRGRIAGGELFIRKDITRAFFGWLSYTLSRSERRPQPDGPWQLFDLDQTHILTLIGVYRLPKHWQVGARFRVVSGNPTTPVVGAIKNESDGSYIPIQGPRNSDRVAPFHQLDIRVDRKWIWRLVSLTTYLDVQNVYNRQNPEFVIFSYDFRAQQQVPSLPIIPSIGAKLEW